MDTPQTPLDRILIKADDIIPAARKFRRRAKLFMTLLWTCIVGGNLAVSLHFDKDATLWMTAGIPVLYGLMAGLLMWGSARWAENWAQRFGPTMTAQTLSRGRLPGFGVLALILCLGPIALIAPLGIKFHLRSFTVYLAGAFGMVCLVQAYMLATRGTMALVVRAREEALRAKLAPHFIFNTLNTLHAQIEADPRGAQATTERLAALFRQVIEAAERPTVPLRDELRFVEAYLGIEQARLGDRLKVRVDVPEELDACELPPLSLQVLVENAVKHGVAPLERGGEIRISARLEGRDLIVEVRDPGPGTERGPGGTGTGTALKTLAARLARPEDLRLLREEGGTVASFRWRQA